jgi:hypothetical protein
MEGRISSIQPLFFSLAGEPSGFTPNVPDAGPASPLVERWDEKANLPAQSL